VDANRAGQGRVQAQVDDKVPEHTTPPHPPPPPLEDSSSSSWEVTDVETLKH
jgi:hypothetical protein